MALTNSNISQRSASELAYKLKLESQLAPKLKTIFRQIGRELSAVYSATGQTQNAAAYEAEISVLLKKYYRKAAKDVGSVTRDNIKSVYQGWETKQEPEVDRAIIDFINEQSTQRASFITDTTNTELGAAVMFVIVAAGIAGETLSSDQIGRRSATAFVKRSMPRAEMIAETEILNAVEGVKFTELGTLVNLDVPVDGRPLTQTVEREWVAVLDQRTRVTHVLADGQRRGLRPFRVGSSRLNYPGDTSLGADLREIIN